MVSAKKAIYKICQTIGADLSSLPTSSKTLIGAIKELDGDIGTMGSNVSDINSTLTALGGQVDNIANSLNPQTVTVTAESTSTGELGSITCTRCGNIVTISVSVRNAASVASGANVYQGRLSSNLPRPYSYISGAAYYGQHAIIGGLAADRTVTARNASSSSVTISGTNYVTMSFTYITQD